jgi:hypothetical protein
MTYPEFRTNSKKSLFIAVYTPDAAHFVNKKTTLLGGSFV